MTMWAALETVQSECGVCMYEYQLAFVFSTEFCDMYLQDYVLNTSYHIPDPCQWEKQAKSLCLQIANGEHTYCVLLRVAGIVIFFSIYQGCATSTGRHHTTPSSTETSTPSVVCTVYIVHYEYTLTAYTRTGWGGPYRYSAHHSGLLFSVHYFTGFSPACLSVAHPAPPTSSLLSHMQC